MQANWQKHFFLSMFTVLVLAACQSTGSTPWKNSGYSTPAQQPPSVLTESAPAPQRTVYNGYNYPVANQQYEEQRNQEIQQRAQVNNGYYGTVEKEGYFDPELAQEQNATGSFETNSVYTQQQNTLNTQTPYALTKSKIAILLPLSGENASIGNALLQSAQMALFDLGGNTLELLPRDTKGTPEGARIAAQEALRDGAQLVLGPVFATSVKAVKPILSRANVNMIAFSTDWSNAGGNTYIMGVMPFTQVNRVTDFISSQGYSRFALVAPKTQYGNVVADAYKGRIRENGGELVRVERYSPLDPNISPIIREFSDFDVRAALREERVQELQDRLAINPNDRIAEAELETLENIQTQGELPFEVVMVPVGGKEAKTLVNLLRFYDVDGENVKLVGTGLWDDLGLAKEPAMQGAYFAAPSPAARSTFEQKYQSVYESVPPRIASLAYDAAALAIVLSRNPAPNRFSDAALTNPNGFAGIDGIFRLTRGGLVQRGLAVLQIQNGNIVVVDPAPTTFEVFNRN